MVYGEQPHELPTTASLLHIVHIAHGLKSWLPSPHKVLSFNVRVEGQAGVIPSQPALLKQNDAKSVPASQRSASGLSSLHLDTITEPTRE